MTKGTWGRIGFISLPAIYNISSSKAGRAELKQGRNLEIGDDEKTIEDKGILIIGFLEMLCSAWFLIVFRATIPGVALLTVIWPIPR